VRKTVLPLLAALALLAAPAAAEASWGAIAVNPESGRYGVAYDYGSAHAAQQRAKGECGDPHCKAAAWVFNGYAALVRKRNGLYFAGIGSSERLAKRNARQRAHDAGARLIATVFSGLS
jgi:hypothetical protein